MSQSHIVVNLLLLGNSSVGKSSLLARFLHNEWSEDQLNPTTGVMFSRSHEMDVKGRKVKLDIWDTAGMERFGAITSSYYRRAQGIIVVYDVTNRESFDALSKWFGDLDTYVSSAVAKIVVGNKVDRQSRQVPASEGQEFATRMDALFIEASAKTAVGVEAAFRNVVERILDTPGLLQSNVGPKSVDVSMEPDEAHTQSGSCC